MSEREAPDAYELSSMAWEAVATIAREVDPDRMRETDHVPDGEAIYHAAKTAQAALMVLRRRLRAAPSDPTRNLGTGFSQAGVEAEGYDFRSWEKGFSAAVQAVRARLRSEPPDGDVERIIEVLRAPTDSDDRGLLDSPPWRERAANTLARLRSEPPAPEPGGVTVWVQPKDLTGGGFFLVTKGPRYNGYVPMRLVPMEGEGGARVYHGSVGGEIGEDGGEWIFRADDDAGFGRTRATLTLHPAPTDTGEAG